MKMEEILFSKFKKGISRGQILFNRYEIWAVAFTRPFGIGTYISYVAGLSRVPLGTYIVLTFFGNLPIVLNYVISGTLF
jgi:membrane protein DedA with SNARE-associated domain